MLRTGLLLSALLLTLQGRLWFGDASVSDVRAMSERVEVQRDQNARFAAANRALEAEILDLRDGLAAMEGRARRELGMIRTGESFFLVVNR